MQHILIVQGRHDEEALSEAQRRSNKSGAPMNDTYLCGYGGFYKLDHVDDIHTE